MKANQRHLRRPARWAATVFWISLVCTTVLSSTNASAQQPARPPAEATDPAAEPPADPPPAESPALVSTAEERADELHLQAKPLVEANKWEEAVVLLAEAYKLKPSHDIATNYGAVLFALDRYKEAAEALQVASTKMPTDVPEDKRKRFDLLNASVRGEVAVIRIRCADAGVTIIVDGKPVGTSPLESEIFLDPGEHRFEGQKGEERTIVIVRTFVRTDDKVVELGELGAGDDGVPLPAIGLMVTGGVFAIIGGALLITTVFDQREDYFDMAAAGGCGAPTGDAVARCTELEDIRQDHNSKVIAGWVSVGVGGAAILGGAIWALATLSSDEDDAAVSLTPIITPHQQGLVVTGTF